MARTGSSMMPLGSQAPDFTLPDAVSGRSFSRNEISAGRPLLVMFICNHCPYAKHVIATISLMGIDYRERVAIVAISSNDILAYPDDSPGKMRETAVANGFSFPYLFDETQGVAHAYGALCTPDFFLFNSGFKCVYRGRLDASTPGNGLKSDGAELRNAIDNLLTGTPILPDQKPSVGCSIKWKTI